MHPNCRCSTSAYSDRKEYDDWLNAKNDGSFNGSLEDWKNIAKSDESGIIKAQRKAYTKLKSDIPSMDGEKFRKITAALAYQGVSIVQDSDGDEYLKRMNAEAMTLSDGTAIIFQSGRVPSASAAFEELIHVAQIRKRGMITSTNNSGIKEYLNREIEAGEKLLRNGKVYSLTEEDIKSVKNNLEYYYKRIKETSDV